VTQPAFAGCFLWGAEFGLVRRNDDIDFPAHQFLNCSWNTFALPFRV
jgi:hypothetical protein